MFNDKITKKIVESAKKVLEAKEEVPPVPPVVMGRLPDVEFKKSDGQAPKGKKMPNNKIPTKNLPLVQIGPGGEYVRKIMPDQVKQGINLKKAVSGAINRLRGK